jgi:N utilization substance protein B
VLALQALFETDVSGHHPSEVLSRLLGESRWDPAVFAYARELIAGVVRHRPEIDQRIASLAKAWPLSQMAAIDRNLLRMGIFEGLYNSHTIPVGVVISEAVELARRFGGEHSHRLVNGVLARALDSMVRDEEQVRRAE